MSSCIDCLGIEIYGICYSEVENHRTNSLSAQNYDTGLAAFPPPDCESSGSLCLGFIPVIKHLTKITCGEGAYFSSVLQATAHPC